MAGIYSCNHPRPPATNGYLCKMCYVTIGDVECLVLAKEAEIVQLVESNRCHLEDKLKLSARIAALEAENERLRLFADAFSSRPSIPGQAVQFTYAGPDHRDARIAALEALLRRYQQEVHMGPENVDLIEATERALRGEGEE